MKYDTFFPRPPEGGRIVDKSPPTPFKATFLLSNGAFHEETLQNFSTSNFPKDWVSIKIHRPTALELFIRETQDRVGMDDPTVANTVRYLYKQGLLKIEDTVPKDDQWINNKMSELKIEDEYRRISIRNWFNDPDSHHDVPFDIDNKILTVKEVPGGRVVVSPVGHTLAYSMAYRIWKFVSKNETYSDTLPSIISVGEYFGRREGIRYLRTQVKIKPFFEVELGCQRIPYLAIKDLAEREEWSKK